ncbi:MAG: hypothetical protein KGI86_03130 [Betaproteobacteria bacterium]|jgi:hypothetical protein|uniref:hypothetical protein n=1 Tax=Thiomonas arsenitoxydans (strain DSM 22701 / CIP 110005 / 3As) TaxID=426114 RepID=UPI001AD51905|nr:hypothetical protein [Thiomonas arsenitoxydans]MBN8776017.1 hypothetical protein [Thiomonas arsenitoxydans]MDE1978302.1 hypothetical protein [Betaproteobacteria bacterium]MDE2267852.1 hypothetical protein [Betaproteobacteria bacterium]
MTDVDAIEKTNGAFAGLFPDAPALDAAQVRLRPADLARMLKVSRQSVSQWVRGGKLRLDPDGRVSAASAMRQLVAHHPERLRAAALAPVVREVLDLRARVAQLEQALDQARADVEFHEGAAAELAAQQAELLRQLETYRAALVRLPAVDLLDAVVHWLRLFADPFAPASPDLVRLLGIASTLRDTGREGAGISRPETAIKPTEPDDEPDDE